MSKLECDAGVGGRGEDLRFARRGGANRNAALPDWREYLNSREKQYVDKIEARACEVDQERHHLTECVRKIRDRCMQRRRLKLRTKEAA